MFKPNLAATIVDPNLLRFSLLVSPKLDGLRCIIGDTHALSRNLKPFRNAYVQKVLEGLPKGLDGELIVGEPNRGHVLNRTQSGIMSSEGKPEFTFWVFDRVLPHVSFNDRFTGLLGLRGLHPNVKIVPHVRVNNLAELLVMEQMYLVDGYEGLMARNPDCLYKFGRSTLNEGGLGKLKRFRDGEAIVVAVHEGAHNKNEMIRDELGRSKRSSHQENMVAAGRVGTIIANDCETGAELTIAPGRMTHDMRVHYFRNPQEILGRMIKYKTFDYGVLNASRFCTFQDFRHFEDL